MIDEVHLLNDTTRGTVTNSCVSSLIHFNLMIASKGATVEAVVCRMKVNLKRKLFTYDEALICRLLSAIAKANGP